MPDSKLLDTILDLTQRVILHTLDRDRTELVQLSAKDVRTIKLCEANVRAWSVLNIKQDSDVPELYRVRVTYLLREPVRGLDMVIKTYFIDPALTAVENIIYAC